MASTPVSVYIYNKSGDTQIFHKGTAFDNNSTIGDILNYPDVISLGITAVSYTVGGTPADTSDVLGDPTGGVILYDVTPYTGDYKIIKAIRNGIEYSVGGEGDGKDFDFLLIAGGGGGGSPYCGAGGGGAGGAMLKYGVSIEKGTYCITIGNGGNQACNGGDSCFSEYIVYGGGAGASGTSSGSIKGKDGGSGGGGYRTSGGCACDFLYGSNGGASRELWGNRYGCEGGGGGGGAGGNGFDGYSNSCKADGKAGDGGKGIYTDISGTGARYAGGGGGYGSSSWSSCDYNVYLGTPGCGYENCGGGGGQGRNNGLNGIFILRYPTDCGYNITGGCKYTCGDYTIHCFTSNGTLCIK